ncbi:MAG TPA: electron transport complex subunit RsxC [Candidatus Tidjanibacter gallistercoris]|nr:electron transport complex subunit RsxC [Candidatus Tidjanibacter gallistercoris]
MLKTFPIGGIHPSDSKISRDCRIESMPLPDTVTIPLSQHIGAPAEAVVAKGQRVRTGQLIGRSTGFVSSNVHSSVTGTVTAVDTYLDTSGMRRPGITIKVEPDEWEEGIDTSDRIVRDCALSPEEIVAKVAAAGVVGMGGATFPTHVKLSVPAGKKAEFLIINGVECEPYLTDDYRVMLERGEELLVGVRILAMALGVGRTMIGIENNKPEAIASLRRLAATAAPEVEVVPLKVRYPQGSEKHLIAALTGRQVPGGGLPVDVGAIVQNVGTALAVYDAVQKNKPLIERVVTVTGKSLVRQANLLVRIGTSASALLEYCGGLPADTGKVIAGGPMMGRAVANLDAPVVKGMSALLVMPESESRRAPEQLCIRCGKCVSVCPMGLEPYLLSRLSQKSVWDEAEAHRITDCIECGSCSWQCPSSLPLLDFIRLGKSEVMKIVRSRKSR